MSFDANNRDVQVSDSRVDVYDDVVVADLYDADTHKTVQHYYKIVVVVRANNSELVNDLIRLSVGPISCSIVADRKHDLVIHFHSYSAAAVAASMLTLIARGYSQVTVISLPDNDDLSVRVRNPKTMLARGCR
jgi:hypothetical protein